MMICPHCKKPLEHRISDAALKRAQELMAEGHSLRSVEKLLFSEGLQASFASLSRHFSKKKGKSR